MEETEEDNRLANLGELEFIRGAGDIVLAKISKQFTVLHLQKALGKYCASQGADDAVVRVAEQFLSLALDCPKRSVWDKMEGGLLQPHNSERMSPDQYLSFFWSDEGHLNETLLDMVNNELQETCAQECPVALQWFDSRPEKEHHDLGFETRLFALIEQLITVLNTYDNDN